MTDKRRQREEAVASSPMVGGRRNSQKSQVQIASRPQPESVTTRETKPENTHESQNVTTRETTLKSSVVTTGETNSTYEIMSIPTSQITPWAYANRPDDEFGDDENWHAFVQSIKMDGIDQPVTVRPKKDGDGYELICGRRRYTAATEVRLEEMPCVVRNLTDQEAAAIQDRENELRKDLSVWARARSWQMLLDAGVYKNKSQLGASMGIDRRYVHKVMVYTRIPEQVLEAISVKANIGMKLAQELVNVTTIKDGQDQKQVAANIEMIKLLDDKISAGGFTDSKLRAAMKENLDEGKAKKKDDLKLPKNIGKVNGINCFNVRRDSNGTPTISILKEARDLVDVKDIAEHLRMMFEDAIKK